MSLVDLGRHPPHRQSNGPGREPGADANGSWNVLGRTGAEYADGVARGAIRAGDVALCDRPSGALQGTVAATEPGRGAGGGAPSWRAVGGSSEARTAAVPPRAAGASGPPEAGPSQGRKFASPQAEQAWRDRRLARSVYGTVLRDVSSLKAVRLCRVKMLPGTTGARLRMADGVAHYAGLMTCGSPWSCPSCAAKIRDARATEIDQVFAKHLANGGMAYFATFTARHYANDDPRALIKMISASLKALTSGKRAQADREALGLLGHVRTVEVTHGRNGFHPHLHLLIATERPLTAAELARLQARWRATWAAQLVKHGGRQVDAEHGFQVEAVRGGAGAVAAYLTKLQGGVETKRGVGQEMARGDLKKGRFKTRGMFDVLASFIATGDVAELEIWNRYEQATKGVPAVRWSNGLRKRLGAGAEATDEELSAAEVEGSEDVLTIGERTWQQVMRTRIVRGADARVLREAERGWANGGRAGAVQAVIAYLISIGIHDPWVVEWRPPDHEESPSAEHSG